MLAFFNKTKNFINNLTIVKNMAYKIDLYDKKLLYELDKDSSITLAKLSHKLKRSKQFILYRLKKLEQAEIITGYNAIIDMSKLGYFTFRVYFKFQQMTEGEGKNFVEYIRKIDQIWTITSMHGKWDYALFFGVKTISEFHNLWDYIMINYKNRIKNYNVSLYAPIYNFNRKFFLENPTDYIERIYGIGEKEEIDKKDLKLIEYYATNIRQSSIDIAKKLKMSPETVRRRIKNLEKRKVIVGYKIGLNLEKLGYTSYRVDIHLISTKRNNSLFEYCRRHKNIYQINKTIGGADFEIEVIVRDLAELIKLIEELKINFKDVINDVEYFSFSTFHILRYIPD